MSGFAGIIRFDGAPPGPGLVEKMTATMTHRGPDGIRHWTNGAVALGQCMLRTTPESLEETQPLGNEDQSLVLVMDGRVDNWQELRRELLTRGALLRDRSDAELVLRAYENWGRECLPHIDGDFALVIWDARRQSAFCARDRLGHKPFNYYWNGSTLVVASEVQAILALPWIKQELNEGLIADYLNQSWVTRDETPWKNIRRLVAAHWMEFAPDGMRSGEYWRPDFHALLRYRRDEEYAEHYRELLTDTVRRLSRSHHQIACEVSGGLDSSAIFALAARLKHARQLAAPDVAGYTLAFDDDPAANDLDYARAVSVHVGIAVHEVNPRMKPLTWYCDWAKTYKEVPSFPNGAMGADIRALARQHGSRALLVGVGGNEWLGLGIDHSYYAEELAAGQWRNFYDCFTADLREAGVLRTGWWLARYGAIPMLPLFVQDVLRHVLRRYRRITTNYQAWLTPRIRRICAERMSTLAYSLDGYHYGRPGQRQLHGLLLGSFNIRARESEERLAASLGIELRRPYWSPAIVQFGISIPERLRLRGAVDRVLHRRAMAGMLPGPVLNRKIQADFMIAFRRYASAMKQTLAAEMSLQQQRRWVLPERMEQMYTQFGDKSFEGAPEWLVWSLFACSALAAGDV